MERMFESVLQRLFCQNSSFQVAATLTENYYYVKLSKNVTLSTQFLDLLTLGSFEEVYFKNI
jgi:hypothetical protein